MIRTIGLEEFARLSVDFQPHVFIGVKDRPQNFDPSATRREIMARFQDYRVYGYIDDVGDVSALLVARVMEFMPAWVMALLLNLKPMKVWSWKRSGWSDLMDQVIADMEARGLFQFYMIQSVKRYRMIGLQSLAQDHRLTRYVGCTVERVPANTMARTGFSRLMMFDRPWAVDLLVQSLSLPERFHPADQHLPGELISQPELDRLLRFSKRFGQRSAEATSPDDTCSV